MSLSLSLRKLRSMGTLRESRWILSIRSVNLLRKGGESRRDLRIITSVEESEKGKAAAVALINRVIIHGQP